MTDNPKPQPAVTSPLPETPWFKLEVGPELARTMTREQYTQARRFCRVATKLVAKELARG